jgi:hypothetical protein
MSYLALLMHEAFFTHAHELLQVELGFFLFFSSPCIVVA